MKAYILTERFLDIELSKKETEVLKVCIVLANRMNNKLPIGLPALTEETSSIERADRRGALIQSLFDKNLLFYSKGKIMLNPSYIGASIKIIGRIKEDCVCDVEDTLTGEISSVQPYSQGGKRG